MGPDPRVVTNPVATSVDDPPPSSPFQGLGVLRAPQPEPDVDEPEPVDPDPVVDEPDPVGPDPVIDGPLDPAPGLDNAAANVPGRNRAHRGLVRGRTSR